MSTIQINVIRLIKIRKYFIAILILLAPLFTLETSCNKLVTVGSPVTAFASNTAFTLDATAISVLTGIYSSMSSGGIITGGSSITFYAGLLGDDYTLWSGVTSDIQKGYYKNMMTTAVPIAGSETWGPLYNFLYKCNAAVEGLTSAQADGLTGSIRQQLLGEAKFLRAFFYFYLVNLFGDVPLPLTTDPQVNTLLARSSKQQVYDQIISDLKDAQGLLSTDYLAESLLFTTSERVRPTKWAATALLARVYLYLKDWNDADIQSSSVIANTDKYDTVPLNSVFIKNSKESIWQLQPTSLNLNTLESPVYTILSTGPSANQPVYLSKGLQNSFETGDKRFVLGNWVNRVIYNLTTSLKDTVYYPYKYKVYTASGVSTAGAMSEYLMVLRLAEQYLIRAEARTQLGNNITGAQADLNIIRARAGLPGITSADQNTLLTAILHERQVELFSEWGHRWFDLKRTGNVDAVMALATPIKSGGTSAWQSYQALCPVALTELQKAPNLTQTPGY